MAEVIKWPDARLEQKCEPVPQGERCRELIEEMFASLGPTGIGLAAPQIGVMKRVIVIKVPLRGLGQVNLGNFVKQAIINPVITWAKPGMQEAMEGCLSFPGVEVSIPRYVRITVQGFDVKWNPITLGAKDLVARALQHEIDHLEGRSLAFYARLAHEANEAALAKVNADQMVAEGGAALDAETQGV
jgi:peptide deformylase